MPDRDRRFDGTHITVVDAAHTFFEDREVKFVNGVLDKLAKDVR